MFLWVQEKALGKTVATIHGLSGRGLRKYDMGVRVEVLTFLCT